MDNIHSHHQAEEGSKSKAVRLLKPGTEKESLIPKTQSWTIQEEINNVCFFPTQENWLELLFFRFLVFCLFVGGLFVGLVWFGFVFVVFWGVFCLFVVCRKFKSHKYFSFHCFSKWLIPNAMYSVLRLLWSERSQTWSNCSRLDSSCLWEHNEASCECLCYHLNYLWSAMKSKSLQSHPSSTTTSTGSSRKLHKVLHSSYEQREKDFQVSEVVTLWETLNGLISTPLPFCRFLPRALCSIPVLRYPHWPLSMWIAELCCS